MVVINIQGIAHVQYEREKSALIYRGRGTAKRLRHMWSLDTLIRLCELVAEEKSDKDIAEEMGETVYAVHRRRMEMGISARDTQRVKREQKHLQQQPLQDVRNKTERLEIVLGFVTLFKEEGEPKHMWTRRIAPALDLKGGTIKAYLKQLGEW